MFNESSSPAFFKIDKDDIGSCYAICAHNTAPTEFRPEIPLHAKLVKDTDWDDAEMEIALIAIPTIAPPPFGKEISSSISDDDFMEERKGILDGHGFGAQTLIDVIDQFEVNNHTKKVLKRIISSPIISTSPDPAHATTKGIRGMTFTSSPFPDTLLTKKNSYEVDQDNLQAFYRHNPTPARASNNHNVNAHDKEEAPWVPDHSTTAAAATNPPPEIFAQLIETMKNIQAPQQPSKIVVKSRDNEETINLAKLQNRMLQLFCNRRH